MGLEGSQHPLGHVQAAVLVIAASSLALPGALGVQQSETTGWIPLEFLVGLWISPRSGVLASSMSLGDEHNSFVCPVPAPALPLCCVVACQVLSSALPFPPLRGFSTLQKTTLKTLHFPQLLVGVCISSAPFSLRLMRGLSIK